MLINDSEVKKVLVVATKFFGDLIISTPGLKSLRHKFPDAEIVLLVRSEYESVLKYNKHINRIISFDFSVRNKKFFQRLLLEISFWKKIRSEKFDAVVSLQPGDRIAFLARISGAKYRVAPRKQSFNFLFNVDVDVEEDSISYLDYYNKIISEFTKVPVESRPEFFIPEHRIKLAEDFLAGKKIHDQDLLIAVHPGASEPTKIWPQKNHVELIKKILVLNKTKVLIIEGPKEEKVVSKICAEINDERVIYFQSSDANDTAALLKKSKLLIAHDTGIRHLAIAVGTPALVLMPEDNKKCWNFYDETDNHYVIFGKRNIPATESKTSPFLDGISIDSVFNKVNEILNNE